MKFHFSCLTPYLTREHSGRVCRQGWIHYVKESTIFGSFTNDDGIKNKTNRNSNFARFARAFSYRPFRSHSRPIKNCDWPVLHLCETTHTLDDKFWIRSFYLQNAHTNLIPGYLKHIFEAKRLRTIEKLLQKREPTFSDDVLAVVNIVLVQNEA